MRSIKSKAIVFLFVSVLAACAYARGKKSSQDQEPNWKSVANELALKLNECRNNKRVIIKNWEYCLSELEEKYLVPIDEEIKK